MSIESVRWWREQEEAENARKPLRKRERKTKPVQLSLVDLVLQAEARRQTRILRVDSPMPSEWAAIVRAAKLEKSK